MTAEAIGGPAQTLAPERVDAFVREVLGADDYTGRSVCVLVPDATRSCPLPLLLEAVHGALAGRVARLTVLVALGTHAGLAEPELAALVGAKPGGIGDRYPGMTVRNHEWWDPAQLTTVGRLSADTVARLSGGRLRTGVDVTVNRAAVEHDTLLVVGPVFPHEVVGFSGGNKYLFPGIAGPQMIDLSHWLGALIGSAEIIGTRGTTPVRAVIDAAAALVPARRRALCVVVESGSDALHSVAYGGTEQAWASAAEVAARSHVRYLDAPVPRVLSVISTRYDELWTAAKGMYKVEPVVADGGEVVLYAPHVRTVSHTHDAEIRAIGYHCREFFTAQWDRYRDHPWGVLAHSTHLRGAGSYDPVHGERCRVTVTLATGIDEATTRSLGLNHRDPAGIDPVAWAADPGTLVVPDAGEILYRLR